MAIVNKGFPGTVNATEYAKSWHLGGSDGCQGTGWLVSQGTGRQTSTAAGDAFASGVLSTNSAPILTTISTPVAGQWFLIVRRIDWAGAGTVTVVAVAHTTTTTTIPTVAPSTFPTINENPGVLYDHKLAWVWVRNADTTMVLFDLRELPLEPRLQVAETALLKTGSGIAYAADATALQALITSGIAVTGLHVYHAAADALVRYNGAAFKLSEVKRFADASAQTSWTTAYSALLQAGSLSELASTGTAYRYTGSAWLPAVPMCRVVWTGTGSTSATPNTFTPLGYTTETFDNAGMHDNVTNPSRLTAPRDGYYDLSAKHRYTTGTAVGIQASKNGTAIPETQTYVQFASGAFGEPSMRTRLALNAGDYAEVLIGATSASVPLFSGYCYAEMSFVSGL